jgi:hypothetical protein
MNDQPESNSEIVLYQMADGRTRLEVQFAGVGLVDAGTDGGVVSDDGFKREHSHSERVCGRTHNNPKT